MTYYIIKTLLTALIIVVVSEIAKKSSLLAAIFISIPLTSLLAFIWLYWNTRDAQKIIDLSYNTIIMVIPSFLFFIVLPLMLNLKQSFTISLFVAILSTSIAYFIFIFFLKKFGVTI